MALLSAARMKTITSRQNPLVRAFRQAASAPDAQGAHLLLDGTHLIRDARAAGLSFDVVAVAASRLDAGCEEGRLAAELERDGVEVTATSDDVFSALSPVRHPSGIVAIARRTPLALADVFAQEPPLILIAVDVQDPGNVGSLLRAAEAGGATGALLCGESANPFSWKALRGSMGSALRLPIVSGITARAALDALQAFGVEAVAAVARHGSDPDAVDWRGRRAIVVGGEGSGLARDVVAACRLSVTIPMAATVESLNVAVAAALLVYAARRQRA